MKTCPKSKRNNPTRNLRPEEILFRQSERGIYCFFFFFIFFSLDGCKRTPIDRCHFHKQFSRPSIHHWFLTYKFYTRKVASYSLVQFQQYCRHSKWQKQCCRHSKWQLLYFFLFCVLNFQLQLVQFLQCCRHSKWQLLYFFL